MTQEDKELILKDLCARLPYGVIVNHKGLIRPLYSVSPTQYYQITLDNAIDGEHNGLEYVSLDIDEVELKPYLRPMSSMTEKEKKIYQSKQTIIFDFKNNKLYVDNYYSLDWLNKKMFDYRGLIPIGLALEAPKDMYNIE